MITKVAAKDSMPALATPSTNNDVPSRASAAGEHAYGNDSPHRPFRRPTFGSRRSSSTWSWRSRRSSVESCASTVVMQNYSEDLRRHSAPDGAWCDDMALKIITRGAEETTVRRNSAHESGKKTLARRNSASAIDFVPPQKLGPGDLLRKSFNDRLGNESERGTDDNHHDIWQGSINNNNRSENRNDGDGHHSPYSSEGSRKGSSSSSAASLTDDELEGFENRKISRHKKRGMTSSERKRMTESGNDDSLRSSITSAASLTDVEFEEFVNRKMSSREMNRMTYSERKRLAEAGDDDSLSSSITPTSRFLDVGARRIRGIRPDRDRTGRTSDVSNAKRVKHSVVTHGEANNTDAVEETDGSGSLGFSIGSSSQLSNIGARRIRARRPGRGRMSDVSHAERVKYSTVPNNSESNNDADVTEAADGSGSLSSSIGSSSQFSVIGARRIRKRTPGRGRTTDVSNAEHVKHSTVPNNSESNNSEDVAEAADGSGSLSSSIGSSSQFSNIGARRIRERRPGRGRTLVMSNAERVKHSTVGNSDTSNEDLPEAGSLERFNCIPSERYPDEEELPGEDEVIMAEVRRSPVRRSSRALRMDEVNQPEHWDCSDDEERMTAAVEAAWNDGAQARCEHNNRRFSIASTVAEEDQDYGYRRNRSISAVLVEDELFDAIPLEVQSDVRSNMLLDDEAPRKKTIMKLVGAIAFLLLIVAVIALAVLGQKWRSEGSRVDGSLDTPPPPPVHDPTLVQIRKEGVLRCGVSDRPGFSRFNNKTGESEGMSVDLCKAVAAAVLGPEYRVEPIEVLSTTRFTSLAGREIDLLMWGDTHTMERDFHEKVTGVGFQFSDPYFYDGLRFAGVPSTVKCADDFNWVGNCSELSICVMAGVTHLDILSPIFPRQRIVLKRTEESFLQGLIDGSCSVIAGELNQIAQITVRNAGYEGEYVYGEKTLSKEPLAFVTRKDDQRWSEVVNWVLRALIHAEKHGMTQENVKTKLQSRSFVAALEAVGNYGEIWARHMEPVVPRKGLNLLYAVSEDGESGLHYSHPLGIIDNFRHEFDSPGTINRIVYRGKLVCGVYGSDDHSIDKDFCRSLAASLFYSDSSLVDFVDVSLSSEDSNFTERLETGEIDVVAGATIDFPSELVASDGTTSGMSDLAFSPAYFYGGNGSAPLALATSQTDTDWSSFVYWVVTIIIWAEENNITLSNFQEAPGVELFGPRFEWMFRGCIFRGNYEIYSRNADNLPRRANYNLLNDGSSPQFYQHQITHV